MQHANMHAHSHARAHVTPPFPYPPHPPHTQELPGQQPAEELWGLQPGVVKGCGEDERERDFASAVRRSLRLYLEVLCCTAKYISPYCTMLYYILMYYTILYYSYTSHFIVLHITQ